MILAPKCPPSPNIRGSQKLDSAYVDSIVTYTCNYGYEMYGKESGTYIQVIKCHVNSTNGIPFWNGEADLVDCRPISCENTPTFSNAVVSQIIYSYPPTHNSSLNESTYFIGTKINYLCMNGYRFDHNNLLSETITCTTVLLNNHSAEWDMENISCSRKPSTLLQNKLTMLI